ncbi:uncharacterized protein LOC125075337 [Vanessa atalanta]|uniref:uncharacterized protein LOC125075337 n=1 Tax=Vanessa atalanta TaxID=42275 RepID=UPI001FCDE4F9|nr:uncharacterized protein LOC125075337 [Vanessa atalanta]
MWSVSSNELNDETKSIPALKNFNPYHILEPIKVETVDRNNVVTGTLIDIKTDENNIETDLNLNGSYLDKVKKTEFTLVDLFENLYVSPQHVLKNDKDNSIDFLETSTSDVKFESPNSSNLDETEDTLQYTKARTFDEIFDSAVSLRFPKLEPICGNGTLSEDTIDAVGDINTLSIECQKPIEKLATIAIPKLEKLINKENCEVNSKYIDPQHRATNFNKSPPADSNFHFYEDHIFNNISEMKLQSLQNQSKETKRNLFQADSVTRYTKDIKSILIDQNRPPIVPISNGVAIPILQTIKKDNKAFIKRRLVMNDSEKVGFTKGPTIYEKSVVLPQIIERLGERKKLLDAKKNIKRKLILDKCNFQMDKRSGNNSSGMINKIEAEIPVLQPEVLMEDCNRERLRALKIRRAFQEFNFNR